MYISVIVCDDCNMRCDYCFEHGKTGVRVITLDCIEKLITEIYSVKNPMHLTLKDEHRLSFTGGEPTLHMDLIEQATEFFLNSVALCSYVDNARVKIDLVTNGVLVNTSSVQSYLNKYKNLVSVVYSIDGIKETHDRHRHYKNNESTFDLILDNILNHSVSKDVVIRGVLTPDSIPYLCDIYKFWSSLDIFYSFCLVRSAHNNIKDLNKVLCEQYKKITEWYINHSSNWVLNHPYYIFNSNYKPHFTQDLLNSITCVRGGIVLDLDGDLLRCIHLSSIAVKDKNKDSISGNISDTNNIDWCRLSSPCRYKENCCETIKNSDCYRCPIGNNCSKCKYENYELYGDFETWSRDFCNIKAFLHLLNAFFKNYWIYIYIHTTDNPKIQQIEDSFYIFNGDKYKYAIDILVPKVWALEVISEEDYTYLVDITKEIGGNINELDSKFFTTEQLNDLKKIMVRKG